MANAGPRPRRVIGLDTSVIVRYLVGTPPAPARRAARLIDSSGETFGVSPVAIAECAHVLRTQYQIDRQVLLEALIAFVQREDVSILGIRTELVVDALTRARSMPGRPIPDALIVAASIGDDAIPLATFDRDQRRYGIEIREP